MANREPTEPTEVRERPDESSRLGAPRPDAPSRAPAGAHAAKRAGYLGFVAHEMRNPLSTALWSAELLARLSAEERGGPRGEKLARMCLRTLARLRHLVEDHFLAERLELHGIPVRAEAVPLAEAMGAALSRVPEVRCDVQLDDSLVVLADRSMLERALEGLVVAAARNETAVRVTAEARDGAIDVRIRGAPGAEDALRMPDRSTPSDPTGRALSMVMAQAVARAIGGALALTDEGYVFTLPADDGHGASGDER